MVGAIGRLRTPATNRLIIQGRTQAVASPYRWLGRQLGREPDSGLQRAILAPGTTIVVRKNVVRNGRPSRGLDHHNSAARPTFLEQSACNDGALVSWQDHFAQPQ